MEDKASDETITLHVKDHVNDNNKFVIFQCKKVSKQSLFDMLYICDDIKLYK